MKIRRLFLLLTVISYSVIFSSCIFLFRAPSIDRPSDENNVKWVSQSPDIWFIVQDHICYGEINLNGMITEIDVLFNYADGITFFPSQKKENDLYLYGLFGGHCKYKKGDDIFTVEIAGDDKGFLDNSIKLLIFTKENYDTGTRWYDDVGSTWVSTYPEIWFTVGSDESRGEMEFNGETIKIVIKPFGDTMSWVFYPDEGNDGDTVWGNRLFRVSCRYGADEFLAYVLDDRAVTPLNTVEKNVIAFEDENEVILFVKEKSE